MKTAGSWSMERLGFFGVLHAMAISLRVTTFQISVNLLTPYIGPSAAWGNAIYSTHVYDTYTFITFKLQYITISAILSVPAWILGIVFHQLRVRSGLTRMDQVTGSHPHQESMGQYCNDHINNHSYRAFVSQSCPNGLNPNLGTHPGKPGGPGKTRKMEGQQNWSQPPNQSMQQQIPSFLSMIPTVRSLECLAWQLFYGPSEVVFDENRWQECFQTFNALAMQSTSLIMMLCQKYEVRVHMVV